MKKLLISTFLCLYACSLQGQCNWPSVNYNIHNTRTNNCETILNTTTVGSLIAQPSLSFSGTSGVQVAPVVQNDIVYFGDLAGNFYACQLSNLNDIIWTTPLSASVSTPATVNATTVYVATNDLNLYALDISTGAILPNFPVVIDPAIVAIGGGDVLAGPVLVDDLVIIPTTNSGGATAIDINPQRHGSLNAFNATTGALVWRTVIQPEPYGAQGGSFSTAAVDTQRQLLFIGTSNSDNYPVSKYTDALLAIDYTNGKIKWSYQFVKNDVWGAVNPCGLDFDVGASPNLFTIKTKKGSKDVVGVASKDGIYRVFTRGSGKLVWEQSILTKKQTPVSTAAPGAAYDKETHTIYAPALFDNSGVPLNVFSVLFLNGNLEAEGAVINSYFNTNKTVIAAIDANTGRVKWRQKTTGATSGSITVANGVVYHGNWRGEVRAYDAQNGQVLYSSINTVFPFPTILGAPITVVNGKVLISTGIQAAAPGSVTVLSLP